MRLLDEDEVANPALSVVNLVDVFLVLVAALYPKRLRFRCAECVNFCSWQGATTLHGRPHVRRSNAARGKKGRALCT